MNNDRKATEVLTALVALELNDWAGLHQDTALDHARQVFDIDEEWCGTGRLGSEGKKTVWYSVSTGGFPEGLRLWVSDGDLILVDAPHPGLPGSLDDLLAALGPPQERLDSYLGTLLIEKSEWVYPGRGLTVFVNPANRRLLRIAVYRPVSLSEYRENLRLNLKKVRLPLHGHKLEGVHR